MKPAAKNGSMNTCPKYGEGESGSIIRPISQGRRVETNSVLQAKATDPTFCRGPKDFLVTGAATVTVNGQPAAREGSKSQHGGAAFLGCSANVLIGGPSAGATLGSPVAATIACYDESKGRHPPKGAVKPNGKQIPAGRTKQSYNNCGIESSRLLLNQKRGGQKPLTEDELYDDAVDHGENESSKAPAKRYEGGATNARERQSILRRHGMDSELDDSSMENIERWTAERRGVITSHWAPILWGKSDEEESGHAINVTGVEYDDAGNLKTVYVVDSGRSGGCASAIPAERFQRSLRKGRKANVTKDPVW